MLRVLQHLVVFHIQSLVNFKQTPELVHQLIRRTRIRTGILDNTLSRHLKLLHLSGPFELHGLRHLQLHPLQQGARNQQ